MPPMLPRPPQLNFSLSLCLFPFSLGLESNFRTSLFKCLVYQVIHLASSPTTVRRVPQTPLVDGGSDPYTENSQAARECYITSRDKNLRFHVPYRDNSCDLKKKEKSVINRLSSHINKS